jgi:hypothetical protein
MHLDGFSRSACYDLWGWFGMDWNGFELIGMDWNGLVAVLTAGGGGCGRQRDPN